MDSPQHAESSPMLPPGTSHRLPIDATLDPEEPKGKLLFSLSLSDYFRPWIFAWAIISASVLTDSGTYSREGGFFIAFSWLFVAWTIIATVSPRIPRGSGPRKGFKLDFGAFVCICFGRREEDDGEEPGYLKSHFWGLSIVDLALSVVYFVFAPVLLAVHHFRRNHDLIVASMFIIAVSQLVIAILGLSPALRQFRLHLYREEKEDGGLYRIQLPQNPDPRKPGPMSSYA